MTTQTVDVYLREAHSEKLQISDNNRESFTHVSVRQQERPIAQRRLQSVRRTRNHSHASSIVQQALFHDSPHGARRKHFAGTSPDVPCTVVRRSAFGRCQHLRRLRERRSPSAPRQHIRLVPVHLSGRLRWHPLSATAVAQANSWRPSPRGRSASEVAPAPNQNRESEQDRTGTS